MVQNGEHKTTVNGIVKGRPGKGRVYTLGQRRTCYAQHRMTDDNIFRYTPKPTKATPKPLERTWCKRCRAASRKRSVVKRLAAAKVMARAQRKEANAQLDAALPKAEGKPRKAAKRRTPTRHAVSADALAGAIGRTRTRVSGMVKVGCCPQTFPDAPSASKHVAAGDCQGKATPKPKVRHATSRKRRATSRKAA
jgi:hypothetical protein